VEVEDVREEDVGEELAVEEVAVEEVVVALVVDEMMYFHEYDSQIYKIRLLLVDK
jgi:hypothetical protein